MDLGRLGKKARNELMRNPKKSAILGIICLVALYFWFPLVRGWITKGMAKRAASGAVPTELALLPEPTTNPQGETSQSLARAEAAYRWDKQIRQRKQDPLMSPAVLAADARDPFRLPDDLLRELSMLEKSKPKDEQPAPIAEPPVELSPVDLGLVLKGTLVSSRTRAATINGRTYRQGARVVAGVASQGSDSSGNPEGGFVEFMLAEVRRDSVVLKRGDKSFTLEFQKRVLPPGQHIAQDRAPATTAGRNEAED